MITAGAILARVRHYGANLALDAGKLRIVNARRLPAGAEATIRDNYAGLRGLLQDEADEFEERAAIVEYDANTPRARAEEFARLCIEAKADPAGAAALTATCAAIIDAAFGRAA